MYAEWGWISNAQAMFDCVTVQDVVLWNALIAAHVKQGHGAEALMHYDKLHNTGISLNAVTYICSLKACVSVGAVERGRKIHAEIFSNPLLQDDLVIGNTLVDMYAKFGLLAEAREVFDMLPFQTVISWTALLAGYAKFGYNEEAMHCLQKMKHAGIAPNKITYACILRACGNTDAMESYRLHGEIIRQGFEHDLTVGSALVDMYSKCGQLDKARQVFDQIPSSSVVLWTTLISGYLKHKNCKEALVCFGSMLQYGVTPNAITFLCGLKACGSIGALDKGQEIYIELARTEHFMKQLPIANALIAMYAKCGSPIKAQEVFDNLPLRDVISWTALISGYVQHDHGQEALECFALMEGTSCSPNAATYVCALQACGKLGALVKGQCLHVDVSQKGLETNLFLGSSLVDMYLRCGAVIEAEDVFKKLPVKDEGLWNALIAGYVQNGESKIVFSLFDKMIKEGRQPDFITFMIMLKTCSQAGLVDKFETLFEAMIEIHGVAPSLEHHHCMIDLLCRMGELIEALTIAEKMPFEPNIVACHSLLSACQKLGSTNLGTCVFDHAMKLNKKNAAVLFCPLA
ncbi:hypothetical protein KP509_18G000200 [Ceratopteris richardii]|nr:hypothetical protein KP509_18G000200 [Ceratopteris richardii]